MKKKITCIIQARMSSKRLPGKVLKKIRGKISFLKYLIIRIQKSKCIDKILIACSKNFKDKKIINFCKKNNLDYFVGSENNVLERYYKASIYSNANNILRITSDCPFTDPKMIDQFIKLYQKKNVDYLSNTVKRTYPNGLDLEIFSKEALAIAYKKVNKNYDKEHVTPYLKRSKKIKKYCVKLKRNLSHIRVTLDTKKDEKFLKMIAKKLSSRKIWPWKKILSVI